MRFLLFFVLSCALGSNGLAEAEEVPQLFGIGTSSEGGPTLLYRFDLGTPSVEAVGEVGFDDCHGLEFDPAGNLLATCGQEFRLVLIQIDQETGAGILIGPAGQTVGAFDDISVRQSDGALFAYGRFPLPPILPPPFGGILFQLDPATGEVLSRVVTVLYRGGNGIAFDSSGTLYHSDSAGNLNQVDAESGTITPLTPLNFQLTGARAILSKDFHPEDDTLYGIFHNPDIPTPQPRLTSSNLVTINTSDGVVTPLMTIQAQINAIAWSLDAPTEAPGNELIVPFLVNGLVETGDIFNHFQSTLTFLNLSDSTITGSLEAFDSAGNDRTMVVFCPEGPVQNPVRRLHLTPNGFQHESTGPALESVNGWVRIRWPEAASIQASVEVALIEGAPRSCPPGPICMRPSTEILTSASVRAVARAREFAAPTFINPNRHSAYNLVNPSASQTAIVEVTLLDPSGMVVTVERNDGPQPAVSIGRIGPLRSLGFLAWEFFEGCNIRWQVCPAVLLPPIPPPENFHGSIRIRSTVPLGVGGLHVLLPEGRWVELPVSPVSE